MKNICLITFILTFTLILHAQKNDHAKGEFLIQLSENTAIDKVLKNLEQYKISPLSQESISESVKIWHLRFKEIFDE